MHNIKPLNLDTVRNTKKDLRNYRRAHKKYLKELVKLAKEDRGFAWGYITDMLLLMMRYRLDYYSKGENVWQADESRIEIIDTLRGAIDKLTNAVESEHDFPECTKGGWTEEALAKYNEDNQKIWDEAFLAISKNIRLWWD